MCYLHIINTINSMTENSNFITRQSVLSSKNYFSSFEAPHSTHNDLSLGPNSSQSQSSKITTLGFKVSNMNLRGHSETTCKS